MPRKRAGKGLVGTTVPYDVVEPGANNRFSCICQQVTLASRFLPGTDQGGFRNIDELVQVVTSSRYCSRGDIGARH